MAGLLVWVLCAALLVPAQSTDEFASDDEAVPSNEQLRVRYLEDVNLDWVFNAPTPEQTREWRTFESRKLPLVVSVATWNTANSENFAHGHNHATLRRMAEALVVEVKPRAPDVVMLAMQENCAFSDAVDAFGRALQFDWAQYGLVRTIAIGNRLFFKKGNCEAGVAVFMRRDSILEKAIKATGTFHTNRHSKLTASDEKGLKGVWMNIQDTIYCLAGTHLRPGETLSDHKRRDQFLKYHGFMRDFASHDKHLNTDTSVPRCDVIFFAGDFNFHSDDGWRLEHSQLHHHFQGANRRALESYFASLRVPRSVDEEADWSFANVITDFPPPVPQLRTSTGAFPTARSEKEEIRGIGYQEANREPGAWPNLVPTFQYIPASKVGTAEAKQPVSFATASGGNDPHGRNMVHLVGSRPVSPTDAVYSWSGPNPQTAPVKIDAFAYGPLIVPCESDHMPVLAMFLVTKAH